MSRALRHTYVAGGHALDCELRIGDGRLQGTVSSDGEPASIDVAVRRLDASTVRIDHPGGGTVRAVVVRNGETAWVSIDGRTLELRVESVGAGAAHHGGEDDFAVSPMTGTLVKVTVESGQAVAEGDELFVVEAMKMEYVVRAPRDVSVGEVRAAVGDQVDQGHIVIAFVEEEA